MGQHSGRRSSDLIDWEQLGDALPDKPDWARTTQDFWAPSVITDGSTYYMYYSATPDACHHHQRGHALAVATSDNPAGPFVDMGMPLLLGAGFEFIDPHAFDDPATGRHLLYWGSGFQPIRVQELGPDRMSFAPGSAPIDLIWPNGEDGGFPRLVEAAWVIHHGGFYYLFYSGRQLLRAGRGLRRDGRALGACDGPVRDAGGSEGRSPQPDPLQEPSLHRAGPQLHRHRRGGDYWIVYHAIDVDRPRQTQEDEINSRRILLMDRIEWHDGWPWVGTPSHEPQAAPVT